MGSHVPQRTVAEQSNYDTVWLKHLAAEIQSEGMSTRLILSIEAGP